LAETAVDQNVDLALDFCKNVASSQTARIAELDSIGASRGERAVLMRVF
jgi:hypothetical protein